MDTSLVAKEAFAHHLKCPTSCKITMATRGPQNGQRGLKRCLLLVGHFKQLLLNKFFDPSTPSMRKVDDAEEKKKKKRKKR